MTVNKRLEVRVDDVRPVLASRRIHTCDAQRTTIHNM